MIRLSFVPDYFPVLLLPFYWVFWVCFYVVYLPVYGISLLLSPWRSRESALRYYRRKAGKDARCLEWEKEEGKEEGDHA